jgi:hypothetical protein
MKSLFALLAVVIALPAFATQRSDCFSRSYSAAHLRANPSQKVKSMALNLQDTDYGISNFVNVRTKNPINSYDTFSNGGGCRLTSGNRTNGTYACGFDSDGGSFSVRVQGNEALLTVANALFIPEALSEVGGEAPVLILNAGRANGVYRLYRSTNSACEL